MPAIHRIEVDARRRRHMRLRKQPLGEIEAVVGKFRNVRVEIERAVDRKKLVEPCLGQAFDQDFPVVLVAVLDRLKLGAAVERGLRRDLRQRRHRDREIALQAVHRAHQRRRHDHPADAPAGHAEVFRERVDDHGVVRHAQRGFRGHRVVEAVIDLVGDEADALLVGDANQVGERLRRSSWCRSDWPGSPPARRQAASCDAPRADSRR